VFLLPSRYCNVEYTWREVMRCLGFQAPLNRWDTGVIIHISGRPSYPTVPQVAIAHSARRSPLSSRATSLPPLPHNPFDSVSRPKMAAARQGTTRRELTRNNSMRNLPLVFPVESGTVPMQPDSTASPDYTQPVGFGRPAILQAPFAGPDGNSS